MNKGLVVAAAKRLSSPIPSSVTVNTLLFGRLCWMTCRPRISPSSSSLASSA